jgi:hypothetical protein
MSLFTTDSAVLNVLYSETLVCGLLLSWFVLEGVAVSCSHDSCLVLAIDISSLLLFLASCCWVPEPILYEHGSIEMAARFLLLASTPEYYLE